LAQDDGAKAAPPPPPPVDHGTSIRWDEVKALVETPVGKGIIAAVVVLTLIRIVYGFREMAKQAARSGGQGMFGKYYAQKELESLMKSGRFEEAAELVLTMGQNGPSPPGDPGRELEAAELFLKAKRFQRAAEIFVRKGKPKRGAEAYERAQQNDLAAELFEKAGDLARAEENYLKAKNKAAVARMWSAAGNSAKAATYFTELSRPRDAAEHLEKLGKKSEALTKYCEAFQMLASSASPDKDRGARGERVLGVDTESKELFSKICALYDELKDVDGYAQFLIKHERADAAAEIYRKAGKLDRAADLLREARQWDAAGKLMKEMGKEREALILFAQARQERGEVEKATELYIEAGELNIAAENYEKIGKTAKAAEMYVKLKDPRRAADLYAKVGDYAKAGALYEQTKQWQAAVFCYEQNGEAAKVAGCWEHLGNHFLAGVSYFQAHETAKSIACLEKVEKESEDRQEAQRLVGILLHELNRDKEAIAHFDEGFGRSIKNDDVESFYYCAQTLERVPDKQAKAISAYETILKLRPHYRDTDKRLAALRAGKPLPKTSIYNDGQDDPGSLFHTSRFSLKTGSEKHRIHPHPGKPV
jgi:tetratricopeptide (TPR) repeat protein